MNWSLEKYTGLKSRHTCPACERKRCFTLYVNEDGESLNPVVGRCDHESACGYHYTPAQYFADHPEASDNWRQNFMSASIKIPKRKPAPKPLCYIPIYLVTRSVNPNYHSDFTRFLVSILGASVWLATGGKSQLGDKLNVLHQRTIVAFPDVDGYDLWKQKAGELSSLRITVSDYLESTATQEEREAHIDIADRLIAQLRDGTLVPPADCPTASSPSSQYGTPLENPDFLQITQYISPEYQGNVAIMMDELGLIPIDVCPLSQSQGR